MERSLQAHNQCRYSLEYLACGGQVRAQWQVSIPVCTGGPPGPARGGTSSAGFVQSSATSKALAESKVDPTLIDHSRRGTSPPRFGIAWRSPANSLCAAATVLLDRMSNQLGLLDPSLFPGMCARIWRRGQHRLHLQEPFPTLPQRGDFPVLPTLYGRPTRMTVRPSGLMRWIPTCARHICSNGGQLPVPVHAFDADRGRLRRQQGSALPTMRAINQPLLASPTAPVNGETTNTTGNVQLRVPYVGFSPTGLVWLENLD